MDRVWCINSIYKRNQQSTNLNTKKRGKESLKKKQQNTPVQTKQKTTRKFNIWSPGSCQ